MRRRTRREPNTSESTGKIGHELPANQPRPLVPSYPQDLTAQPAQPAQPAPARTESPLNARPAQRTPVRPVASPAPAANRFGQQPPSGGRLEMETQPESAAMSADDDVVEGQASQEPKGFVVLTIGLPGSGKTTWYKRRGVTPLSSDMLRTILFDDITEQRYQGLVFSTLRSLLRARLIARMPWNYVDATNLSPHERRQWIKMATSFGYEVQAVFFDVPLAVCLERNARRDRPVSEEAMQKMAERLKPPVFEEGFTKITVVRVKPS